MRNNKKRDTKSFIQAAISKHGNKFDYSRVDYRGSHDTILIICPIHGVFSQIACAHLRSKYPCAKCFVEFVSLDTESFIKKASKVHLNKYSYTKVLYINTITEIEIICPIHESFLQKPLLHIRGYGCKKCKANSVGEDFIARWLSSRNIQYVAQKTFPELTNPKTGYKLRVDFYLPEQNLAIEFDGIQHDGPFDFRTKSRDSEKAIANFEDLKYKDSLKDSYLKQNNIKLLRIKYKDRTKIPLILEQSILASKYKEE